MEFIEGGNLRELLKIRTKFEAKEFLKLAKEMVEGLRYALSRGVTHRDIKPTNILITSDGRVKWVDFGLAGVMEQAAAINKTFGIVQEQRTVDYAGLEKATGAPKGDPRSDIFFLGNVFHHMLTGEPALDETKDRQARMLRNRFENPTPLTGNAAIPREVAAVVDRMLAFRPETRYQNYDQVLRDLEDAERVLAGDVPAGGVRPGVKPRVVVVHESNSVKDAIKTKLTEKGCQVVLTTDVERAAALHAMNPFDVMVLDLDTVGEAGVNAFQRVARQSRSGKPCTAVFLAEGEQRGWTDRLKGAEYAVISKPLTLRDLYQTVLSRVHMAE
jgi:serine/threonine protein kinase